MRKWSHLHSIGGGAVLMALLTGHLIWTLTIVFTLGLVVGLSWRTLGRGAHAAGSLLAARVATEAERRKGLRSARRAKVDVRRASRDMLDRAYKQGVIEGRLDR